MTDDLEREALRLCEAVIDQPAEQREKSLREFCGENTALYERTKRLLQYVQATDYSLPLDLAHTNQSEIPPPDSAGPYRVLELIGRGGMGSVYRGERADGAFERTVAIKFVGAIHERSDAEQRFTNERQILARMSHPNIAQLLDGGTVDNRGFLVMEYVEGLPFGYNKHRPISETLESFGHVCAAVQYAHNNLILHRDIKPDNVLINPSGQPKLLDFGIAKLNQELTASDAGDLTGTKAAPLTLNYSAPERLLGEPATVSSDVYSLGVYLYVLMHGVRPYDLSGKTLPEAWKLLRERTAEHAAEDFGDLGLIAEKAMHNDALSRYSSAAELAADINRFQAGQTVSARPADWRYSFKRFVSRNKLPAAAVGIGLIALLSAFLLTTLAYLESERQAKIAESEAITASQTVEFLRTVLSSANPYISNQKDLSIAEVLKFASQKLEEASIDNPVARAYVETALAMAHDGRGEFEQALNYANAAVQVLDEQNIRSSGQRDALYAQALILIHDDQPAEALSVLERLMLENAEANTLESWMVVETHTLIANALENLAQETKALESYASALELANRLTRPNAEARIVLLNNYGKLLHQQGEYDLATDYYTQSLNLSKQNRGTEVRQAILMSNIAGIYGDQEIWSKAIPLLEEALKVHEQANNLTSPDAIISRTTLANFQRQSGNLSAATETIQRTLKTVRETLPSDHFITAYVENVAAVTLCDTPQWAEGLKHARSSLSTREKIMPPEHWILASGKSVLGKCETRAGNFSTARTLLTQALGSLTELRGADGTQTRQTRIRLEELNAAELLAVKQRAKK